jgi:hypothetical protein
MFENLITTGKTAQTENLTPTESLTNQVMKILAGKCSNPATLKFISQLQTGKIFDAVFTGKIPGGKGVLSLEGKKVIVELPKAVSFERQNEQRESTRAPLDKGQTIRVRVESPGPRPALKIISPPSRKDLPENVETKTNLTSRGKSISRQFHFEEFHQVAESNRMINARVTRIVDSKSISVNTGNKNIVVPVENAESLKPGSPVSISFVKTEKGLIPVLIETSANITKKVDFNSLKPYLPARMPVTKMATLLTDEILDSPVIQELKIKPDVVARLRATLQLLLPQEGKLPTEGQVRQQVESSGINYEAKVRQVLESGQPAGKELASDLKGLLLELFQSTDNIHVRSSEKAPGTLTEFRQTLKFAIDNIELNQLFSQISKQENQPLLIQIPNPLSSGNKTIQLYVRKDSTEEEAGNKKNSHNVAFFLDLSFLGKIKINAQIGEERLSVRIDAESEEIASFINDKAGDFKAKMSEHDIETSVECCATHDVKPAKDSLIELLVSQNTPLVNIKT